MQLSLTSNKMTATHLHNNNNNHIWPPVSTKRRPLIYYISCILFALLTSLVIVLNGADCLSNQTIPTDRIHVLKSAAPGGLLFQKSVGSSRSKDAFKEVFDNKTILVKENTPIGTKLDDLQADDPDHLGEAQEVIWAFVGEGDKRSFTLRVDKSSKNTASLVSDVEFDYESAKKSYQVRVRATSTYQKYDIVVDILVQDENDNRPQLEDFAIVFNNYKNNFPNYPIGRVPAYDADANDQLHYKVLSGNNAQLILVNETTGDIQLSPWLNSNVPMRGVITIAVSDGVNEVVAQLVLSVNLVTEFMLQNSVVLRLDGIGRDEFLTRKYDIFLAQMARILSTSGMYAPKDIVVFDVDESLVQYEPSPIAGGDSLSYRPSGYLQQQQQQQQQPSSNLTQSINVSFSARTDGSNDIESYLSSQHVEERIYLSRAHLMQALDVQIAPFQDNLCVQEPCQNYQECQATYKFDRALRPFNDTAARNMIFRPIRAVQSFSCSCPPSFTGMKHKNECSLQINQCYSNPCLNGGTCHRNELGYTCECRPEFVGARCEHSFANSTCQSPMVAPQTPLSPTAATTSSHLAARGDELTASKQVASLCGGKSRCVNTNKPHYFVGKLQLAASASPGIGGLHHQLAASSASQGGGFNCQGCPYPQWSTDLCQLRTRSFAKGSYITLPSLRRRHRFHIQLQFATVQNDALLLYNGRYNDKHDFIALEIVDSYLRFSYSLGNTKTSVALSSIPVSNGAWHKVAIDYRDRNVTLLLDNCDPVIDEALARIQGGGGRRCSNSSSHAEQQQHQQTSGSGGAYNYRMLDLSSPMQLGALPPLPTEFQISSLNSFVGCMSDIYIDHQLVDLYSPVQDVGTQIGCPEKRPFCQQHTCNGQPCQDSWGSAKCLCGDEYLGKNCEIYISNEKVRRFNGNSYLTYSPIESTITANWQMSFYFRTINPNGLLMKLSLDPDASITLDLINGALRMSYARQLGNNLSNITINKVQLDDGEWHYAELAWPNDYVQLLVDYNPNLSAQSAEMGSIAGSVIKTVTIGASLPTPQRVAITIPSSSDPSGQVLGADGLTADFSSSAASTSADDYSINSYANSSGGGGQQSFVGCIYGVNVSDNLEAWLNSADPSFQERNTDRGCQVADVCEANLCPANSRCVRKGMNQKRCVCLPGFIGDRCLPVCDLSPCQGENSKCIPATMTTPPSDMPPASVDSQSAQQQQQYRCECETYRSGKNCEHQLSARCPSNWWGRPATGSASNASVCGIPCNCDESRGFDGDCDKLTGHCFCKQDHYRPPGSDYCLPCDCYAVGSLSAGRMCNATTGQCKCREGVVGRRCDTCASPYAEVTLRGCEVIYDACPKTFSDGVWWDKSPLDKLVEQPCPARTSTGTALRLCHPTEGWQRAIMFDCISNTFTDLFNQYQLFEENKFPLSASLAIKTASNLRQALNETITNPASQLYGSDMYISFRLIHHLIQHESQQTGLNLTHRQDRAYIRNIVECINYILDPAHADNWPEIAARSPNGGAEHLLKLMDTYGKVLIESQSDTNTAPFEVSTRYFTFGMDTISADHLWDLSKSPSPLAAGSLSAVAGAHSSPPYATFPYGSATMSRTDGNQLAGTDQSSSSSGNGGGPLDMTSNMQHFNQDGTSIYLDHSLKEHGGSPAVVIPKYDHYSPPDSIALSDEYQHDLTTKAIIPLKTLRIKTPAQVAELSSSPYYAKSRAKRGSSIDDPDTSASHPLILPEFKLPVRQQPSALVAYSIFRSLGPLLPNYHDTTVQHRFGTMASTNAPVVWLTLRPANGSEFLNKNIQPKINYMFKMLEPSGKTRPQCAVWDFAAPASSSSTGSLASNAPSAASGNKSQSAGASYRIKQTGRFTTKGCEVRGIHPNQRLRYKYEYVNCSCDHLGAVTVLMDTSANYDYLSAGDESSNKDFALTCGLLVSLVVLVAILFILTCIRGHSIKSNSNSINKNLVFILILIELLILYTIISRSSLIQRDYQCKLVAIFLHYFSISLFFWLLVNAVHFYRMLTELRDINHGPMRFYHVIGYAFPAFFVAIAVGLRMEHFGNQMFCWLSIYEPIIWSMFGPISFVSGVTIILFVLALCKSLPVKSDPSGADLLKNHMLINTIKTPLIGIYWIITVYVVNEALLDNIYLFPVIAATKSLILFAVLCIIDKHIRYNLYVSWLRFKGEKVPFMVDQENMNYSTSSQQWMPPNMFMVGDAAPDTLNKLYPPFAAVTTPGFQSSCTDIFRPDVLAGFSATSTTSRSSATGTSSSVAYQYQQRVVEDTTGAGGGGRHGRTTGGRSGGGRGDRHRRRHKKSHRHHRHHHHHHHHHHSRSQKSRHQQPQADDHHYDHYESRRLYDQQQQQQQRLLGEKVIQDELASSHSSDDGDDISTLPKKIYDHNHHQQQQQPQPLQQPMQPQQNLSNDAQSPHQPGTSANDDPEVNSS